MIHPQEIEWNAGELPDVHSVPKGCSVLAWFVQDISQEEWNRIGHILKQHGIFLENNGNLRRIGMCVPWENDLNPLRWVDSGGMPIGYHEKVTYWAWINK